MCTDSHGKAAKFDHWPSSRCMLQMRSEAYLPGIVITLQTPAFISFLSGVLSFLELFLYLLLVGEQKIIKVKDSGSCSQNTSSRIFNNYPAKSPEISSDTWPTRP